MTDPRDSPEDTDAKTPTWVKVFGLIFLAAVLLFLILMFTRGPHRGPRDHFPSGAASDHARPGSGP